MNRKCWLCGKLQPLTVEHIPPFAAFNEYPLLLQHISDATCQTGVITWENGELMNRGMSFRSLCGRCNSKAGAKFAPAYISFVKKVAETICVTPERKLFRISGIFKPHLVLRQILHQFVTSNGESFVDNNLWVRDFLFSEKLTRLPPEVYIYLFAIGQPTVRTTGISGHIDLSYGSSIRVLSEFTFWPLGTVLSFGPLPCDHLTPIQQWADIPYRSSQKLDIDIWLNPVNSSLPVDFRTKDEIVADRSKEATNSPSESDMRTLQESVLKVTGEAKRDNFILAASPSQVERIRSTKKA